MASKFVKIVGGNLSGITLGTLVGYGSGHLIDAVARKLTGSPIPLKYLHKIAPALEGGLSMSHALWMDRERSMLNDAIEGS